MTTGGYESLVWIRDKDGREFACPLEAIKGKVKEKDTKTVHTSKTAAAGHPKGSEHAKKGKG